MATSASGKEFRAARDRGDTEFEFGGKKYNTKLKEEVAAPAKKAASASEPETKQTGTPDLPVTKSETPAPKKEYYRSVSGKMVEKPAPEAPDEDGGFLGKRMRAALGSSYKKGGSVSSASSRADGIAQRGKTRGTIVMCGGGMARGKK